MIKRYIEIQARNVLRKIIEVVLEIIVAFQDVKSSFYDANRVKTGIALFKSSKDPALSEKWLQVIKSYRRSGGADKFSKTKN